MKSKKGFTLIELLAVIVILAVIALIATPVVLDSINKARLDSKRASAYGFVDAAQYSIANLMLSGSSSPTTITATTGIDSKGTKPTSVNLTVSNGVITNGYVLVDGTTFSFSNGIITN